MKITTKVMSQGRLRGFHLHKRLLVCTYSFCDYIFRLGDRYFHFSIEHMIATGANFMLLNTIVAMSVAVLTISTKSYSPCSVI